MTKQKKKLTAAQKTERKLQQKKYMTILMSGKQRRVKRPPTVDGVSIDKFISNNVDQIWLHQNEMWECMDITEENDTPEK